MQLPGSGAFDPSSASFSSPLIPSPSILNKEQPCLAQSNFMGRSVSEGQQQPGASNLSQAILQAQATSLRSSNHSSSTRKAKKRKVTKKHLEEDNNFLRVLNASLKEQNASLQLKKIEMQENIKNLEKMAWGTPKSQQDEFLRMQKALAEQRKKANDALAAKGNNEKEIKSQSERLTGQSIELQRAYLKIRKLEETLNYWQHLYLGLSLQSTNSQQQLIRMPPSQQILSDPEQLFRIANPLAPMVAPLSEEDSQSCQRGKDDLVSRLNPLLPSGEAFSSPKALQDIGERELFEFYSSLEEELKSLSNS